MRLLVSFVVALVATGCSECDSPEDMTIGDAGRPYADAGGGIQDADFPSDAGLDGGSDEGFDAGFDAGASLAALTTFDLGRYHGCRIRETDGIAECWGNAAAGAGAPTMPLVHISAGFDHTCGLRDDRHPICWGADRGTPPDEPLVALVGASTWSCGIREVDLTLVCWSDVPVPEEFVPPAGQYTDVWAGGEQACALELGSGDLVCWGRALSVEPRTAGPFESVSVGYDNACVVQRGSVRCWGDDSFGQVAETPTDWASPPVEVAVGFAHVLVLSADGSVRGWGEDMAGQLIVPTGSFTKIWAGGYFNSGRRESGDLAHWGSDDQWQLRDAPPR